jgi:hypothetical protein
MHAQRCDGLDRRIEAELDTTWFRVREKRATTAAASGPRSR